MKHAYLGRTGLQISRLVLGTGQLGLQVDERTSLGILDAAADAGITTFDTADVYPMSGPITGVTEEILGRWLSGKRHQYLVATKFGGKTGPEPWDRGVSRKHLFDAVDASLKRLGTDYIDILQIHHDDPAVPLDEVLRGLDAIVSSGRVRYVGCSNFLAYRLALALGRSEAGKLVRLQSVQPRYNLLFRQAERELLPLALEEGISVIPYNSLAGGLLTGKHSLTSPPPGNTRFGFGTSATIYQDRYWHEREFAAVDAIKDVAAKVGLPIQTLAIAWVLANPAVTSSIVGATRPEHLRDSIAAEQIVLDAETKAALDQITRVFRSGDAEK